MPLEDTSYGWSCGDGNIRICKQDLKALMIRIFRLSHVQLGQLEAILNSKFYCDYLDGHMITLHITMPRSFKWIEGTWKVKMVPFYSVMYISLA